MPVSCHLPHLDLARLPLSENLGDRAEGDRDNHNDAADSGLPVDVDAEQDDHVLDDTDDRRTDQGACRVADAAGKRDAADNGRGDGVHRPVLTDGGLGGSESCHIENSRKG